jgi:hypothetical protein
MIQYCPTIIILEDIIKKALFETRFYFSSGENDAMTQCFKEMHWLRQDFLALSAQF